MNRSKIFGVTSKALVSFTLGLLVWSLGGSIPSSAALAQSKSLQEDQSQRVEKQRQRNPQQASQRKVDKPTDRRGDKPAADRPKNARQQDRSRATDRQNRQRRTTDVNPARTDRKEPADGKLTAARKSQLKSFLNEHRPQLLRLLNWLEKNRPEQFKKAVAPLVRVQDRLQALEKKNPQAYQTALDDWKLDADIQLAAARLAVKDTPQNRDALRALLVQQQAVKVERLRRVREQLMDRVEKLSAQIRESQPNREVIDKAMNAAVRRASRLRAAVNAGKDAASKKSKQTPQRGDETDER